jgi:menaquinone-dependent protoporphyrinogen oxidase
MPILVAYATRYGSTREVAEVVAETLRENELAVDLAPVRDVGAPLYMFRRHKDARRFLSRHRRALMERPVAIFAPGPVHDPHDEEEWRNSRAQLDKELANYPWLKPAAVEIVGGKFDPSQLRFPINVFAGKEPASDIRDWEAIRAWARELAGALRQSG